MVAEAGLILGALQSYGETRRAREQGRIQTEFAEQALQDLGLAQKSLRDSLGSSLALPTLESERTLESVSDSFQRTMEQVGKKQDQIVQSTGFANIAMDDDMIKDVRKEFQNKREDIDIALTKNLSDILSKFEQEKFKMQSQRQQLEMQRKLAKAQSKQKYFGIFG